MGMVSRRWQRRWSSYSRCQWGMREGPERVEPEGSGYGVLRVLHSTCLPHSTVGRDVVAGERPLK